MELTHCSRCGRKLRKKEFVFATNMPPGVRWLGHAAGCTPDDGHDGPSATADQIRQAKMKESGNE